MAVRLAKSWIGPVSGEAKTLFDTSTEVISPTSYCPRTLLNAYRMHAKQKLLTEATQSKAGVSDWHHCGLVQNLMLLLVLKRSEKNKQRICSGKPAPELPATFPSGRKSSLGHWMESTASFAPSSASHKSTYQNHSTLFHV